MYHIFLKGYYKQDFSIAFYGWAIGLIISLLVSLILIIITIIPLLYYMQFNYYKNISNKNSFHIYKYINYLCNSKYIHKFTLYTLDLLLYILLLYIIIFNYII